MKMTKAVAVKTAKNYVEKYSYQGETDGYKVKHPKGYSDWDEVRTVEVETFFEYQEALRFYNMHRASVIMFLRGMWNTLVYDRLSYVCDYHKREPTRHTLKSYLEHAEKTYEEVMRRQDTRNAEEIIKATQ